MRTLSALAILTVTVFLVARMPISEPEHSTRRSSGERQPASGASIFTPRMLVAPGALMGPGPSEFGWSPVGSRLTYVEPQEGQDQLWVYDAATGEKKMLLDPAQEPGAIDVTTAQWSPRGDRLLLSGDDALWLLDVATGQLSLLVEGDAPKTGVEFAPAGASVSYVQDNDLYAALDDQLTSVEYLKSLPYVESTLIGTDGKSFGGYMTLYALLHAPDVSRCGIAGAAPTNWAYYYTIYTERYMRTPDTNAEGYAATDLVAIAGQIQARPLLIHGLADTNVHLQNTVNFVQALEEADKLFEFVPLPNLSHSFHGDGLLAALMASVDYLCGCLRTP